MLGMSQCVSMVSQVISSYSGQLTWLKGESTNLPPPGRPAVLELWATWCDDGQDCSDVAAQRTLLHTPFTVLSAFRRCPPCKQMIPHLTKIQREYGDRGLVVVGISVEAPSPQLTAFVAQQGDKMDYIVACSERWAGVLMSARFGSIRRQHDSRNTGGAL